MKKYIIGVLVLAFAFSCEVDNTVYLEPTVITYEPESILTNSAIFGGQSLGEGGLITTEFGMVWSTNFPPTINDNKRIEGERLGAFSSYYSGLEPNTTYYCSTYGINDKGVGYGDIWEFTTSAEAPCVPQNNYFSAQSTLSMENGPYTSTSVQNDYSLVGGDYHLRAKKGYISNVIEVEVHFDGHFEDLLSGAYPIVGDLDSAFQTPNKAAVRVRYSNIVLRPSNEGLVYVERVGDDVFVTMCDLEVSGTYNFNEYEAIITTKFQVSE